MSARQSGGLDTALLAIDTYSGEILEANEAAADLLGLAVTALSGQTWPGVLACDATTDAILTQALKAGGPVSMPPFLARYQDGSERVLSATVGPPASAGVANIVLWPLLDSEDNSLPGNLAHSDTLVVLGVDGLSLDGRSEVGDSAQLMTEVHRSLTEIVRKSDTVGEPAATSVFIIMRDISPEGARDICRALLSHLHRDSRLQLAQNALRICIGVAQGCPGASALSSLLAANHALLVARGQSSKSIYVASADDYARLAGRVLADAGVYRTSLPHASAPMPGEAEPEPVQALERAAPPVAPIEKDIEGYVVDNMEGAVDQAIFLANLDVPVAVLGPAGTGKMYIARIIHEESGGAPDMLISLDCRDFRSRNAAHTRITEELGRSEGKTLVFKSPHLMHAEVQLKLARQISTRRFADASPPRYLPRAKLIALFPEALEVLIRRGELTQPLASAFAGYPITVPPIQDRKQAVLRWAHKILGQESTRRDRDMKGFTPDAEQAMLGYDWPGNISEMRECIHDALDKTGKDWLTPVDLGLFKGIDPQGAPEEPTPGAFLATPQMEESEEESYTPTTREAVQGALGEAVHQLLAVDLIKPLGQWLEDDLVLAALDRYRGDMRRAAEFLHTRPRNIGRWLPRIADREDERNGSALWQEPRRLLREWVRETPSPEQSPLDQMGEVLMTYLAQLGGDLSTANRARIMGVSTPTYLKRLKEQNSKQGD